MDFDEPGDDEIRKLMAAGKININKTDSRFSELSSPRETGILSIRGTVKELRDENDEDSIYHKFSAQPNKSPILEDPEEELDKEEELDEDRELDKKVTDADENQAAARKGFGEEDNEPTLYEGKSPLRKAWWISKVFFFWLNPLMSFAAKHKELKLENYGEMRDSDQAYHQIERLGGIW